MNHHISSDPVAFDSAVHGLDVRGLGACGNETADDAPAIQRALDSGAPLVVVKAGRYRIGSTLRIGSGTRLIAHPQAIFRLADRVATLPDQFLLTNRNTTGGDSDILVQGGQWDGNGANNPRCERYVQTGYTGVIVNFVNVKNLTLRQMTLQNPATFAMRLGEVSDFIVEDILLDNETVLLNQDGIHVGGFAQNGLIRGIRSHRPMCPNDDMVALNADDDVKQAFNNGMKRGPIRNIRVEDIEAPDAWTFLRILSSEQPIENIEVRGIRGGCRYHAINMGTWEFPVGSGKTKNIRIRDVDVTRSHSSGDHPLLWIQQAVSGLVIERFTFRETIPFQPCDLNLRLHNNRANQLTLEGLTHDQVNELAAAGITGSDAVRPMTWIDDVSRFIATLRTDAATKLVLTHGGFERLCLDSL